MEQIIVPSGDFGGLHPLFMRLVKLSANQRAAIFRPIDPRLVSR